jgi:hypothetical protein
VRRRTLTNLRSLELWLWWKQGEVREQGWLTQLSYLTSLHVTFGAMITRGVVTAFSFAFDDVAASVPLLPALRALKIVCIAEKAAVLSAAACVDVAPARGSLALLHLHELRLPAAMFAEVLPQLTGLTCLRLERVVHPASTPFGWLAVLPACCRAGWWRASPAWTPSPFRGALP